MIGQLIESGCRATPGLRRWYLNHYVWIKRFEKRARRRLGLPTPPSTVGLLLTYACNFACDHCESSSHVTAERGLPFATVASLIREMREMGVAHLRITGGEPLVRRDVFDIVELATEQGLRVHLATNGSQVEQHRARFTRLKLASVFTSVDGLEETNDRFRHHPGAFKKTFRALEVFKDMGIARRMINTLVHPGNLRELEELGEWIMGSAATCWRIALAIPAGRAKGEDRFCLRDDQVLGVLDYIREQRTQFQVMLSEEVGYLGPWNLRVRSKPFAPSEGLSVCAIMPTGDVLGATNLHDATYSEGNIKDRSLREIWHTGFQRYREPILPEECHVCRYLPACGGGTFGMRVGGRHCNKRLWETHA